MLDQKETASAPLVADSAATSKWLKTAQARAAIAGHQLTKTPNGFMLSRWTHSKHCEDLATVDVLLDRMGAGVKHRVGVYTLQPSTDA